MIMINNFIEKKNLYKKHLIIKYTIYIKIDVTLNNRITMAITIIYTFQIASV